ncbi:YjjI family glycine radical enzyme [Psychromonas sp. CD1]|uniref:YjjI family glycine radical enzyme n=1 Tax=Psychromonas sp. CD1 TaxID=1979839 RepID=UPI000B9AABDA|nr:YjjI family glycine radical enzyme [Psychromonas sp. CD1]
MSQQSIYDIISNANLSVKQKTQYLALEAEASLPYLDVNKKVRDALNEGILCDMFEGNAPFKARYVLPDYAKFLAQGSKYLELNAATNFDEALNLLTILYHHVPSVTTIPVYLGHLDNVLLPYVDDLTEDNIYQKLKLFWIMLDRTLPDAFMHVNIGPTDNIICRTILRIDAELKQIAPNLTFMYDASVTPDDLLRQVTKNICECSKPHIANYVLHAASFDASGFGIVSCYNSLPLGGGANTLVRMNLKKVAEKSKNKDDFINIQLPKYSALLFDLINIRSSFLHEKSHFFSEFLVTEGLIYEDRFAPMFGIYAMAEAVETLLKKDNIKSCYGQDKVANTLSYTISKKLSDIVTSTPVKYGYHGRALLHAQGGISLDKDCTPGVRIAYGKEPDPIAYIQATAPHHQYYRAGISDILSIDVTVKSNPEALYYLAKGSLKMGYREFTANIESNDLVRVTGYMVKRSSIAKFAQQGSRINTTVLGAEALQNTHILKRRARVISLESTPIIHK